MAEEYEVPLPAGLGQPSEGQGGGLPAYVHATITESRFGRNPLYNEGKTLVLAWKGTIHEAKDGEGNVITAESSPLVWQALVESLTIWPCGNGWDTFDSGATAEYAGQAPLKPGEVFNKRSLVMRMVYRVAQLDQSVITGIAQRGPLTNAAIWEGLDVVMEVEHIVFGENRKTKEEIATDHLMPVKVSLSGGIGAVAAAAPVATPAAPATPTETTSGILSLLPPAQQVALRAAAGQSEGNANKFAELAIGVEGVIGNDDIMSAIASGALYKELTS